MFLYFKAPSPLELTLPGITTPGLHLIVLQHAHPLLPSLSPVSLLLLLILADSGTSPGCHGFYLLIITAFFFWFVTLLFFITH